MNNSDHEESDNLNPKWLLPLLGIFLLVGICQVILGGIAYQLIPDSQERAEFGEMFGFVETLFSGLAFAGVIYAIYLQRLDLNLQRQELRLTREELKRTAEAQEESAKAQTEQLELNSLSIAPFVFMSMSRSDVANNDGFSFNIKIENPSNNDAIDIRIHIFATYNMDIDQFIEKYCKKSREILKITPLHSQNLDQDKSGIFLVLQFARMLFLRSGSEAKCVATFPRGLSPLNIEKLYIICEYRDLQGTNYRLTYSFRKIINEWAFEIENIEPIKLIKLSPVEYVPEIRKLKDNNNEKIPYLPFSLNQEGHILRLGYDIEGWKFGINLD